MTDTPITKRVRALIDEAELNSVVSECRMCNGNRVIAGRICIDCEGAGQTKGLAIRRFDRVLSEARASSDLLDEAVALLDDVQVCDGSHAEGEFATNWSGMEPCNGCRISVFLKRVREA